MSIEPENNRKKGRPKLLLLLLLVGFMAFAEPRPAMAQLITWDPIQTAKMIIEWAIEAARWLEQEMLMAAQAMATVVASEAQLEGQKTLQQISNDQSTKNAQATANALISKDYIITSGNKICTITAESRTSKLMMDNAQFLVAAQLATGVNAKPNQSLADPAARVQQECNWNLIDTRGTKVQSFGGECAKGMTHPEFVNLDQNASAVAGPLQYSLPHSISVDPTTGILNLPPLASLDLSIQDKDYGNRPSELEYVAAVSYCLRQKPSSAPPIQNASQTGTTSSGASDIATFDQNRSATPAIDCAYDVCMEEVAKRTAVGQAVAGKSAALQALHNAQVRTCELMQPTGVITMDELNDCEQNGMSVAKYQDLKSHKHNRQEYENYVFGSGSTNAESEAQRWRDIKDANDYDIKRGEAVMGLAGLMSVCKSMTIPTIRLPDMGAQPVTGQ